MKEYIELIDKLHSNVELLSIRDKYDILGSALAETKALRYLAGAMVFILAAAAAVSGLALGILELPLKEPFGYIVSGIVSSTCAYVSYRASQRLILRSHLSRKYA